MSDTYKTIIRQTQGLYKDKGSKFIGIACPVESEAEVKEQLSEIKKQFHDARHHCYAYAIGKSHEYYRINDDGEPSGTAGKPIYGQILSFELTNILIVVVRYFGGTKLGVRGLINAYRAAAREAIEKNTIEKKYLCIKYKVEFDYAEMNDVMRVLKENNLPQLNHNYKESCSLEFSVRESLAKGLVKTMSAIKNVKIYPVK